MFEKIVEKITGRGALLTILVITLIVLLAPLVSCSKAPPASEKPKTIERRLQSVVEKSSAGDVSPVEKISTPNTVYVYVRTPITVDTSSSEGKDSLIQQLTKQNDSLQMKLFEVGNQKLAINKTYEYPNDGLKIWIGSEDVARYGVSHKYWLEKSSHNESTIITESPVAISEDAKIKIALSIGGGASLLPDGKVYLAYHATLGIPIYSLKLF